MPVLLNAEVKMQAFHELGNIINFTMKVKITENSSPKEITHTQDFTKYFLEVDLLPRLK